MGGWKGAGREFLPKDTFSWASLNAESWAKQAIFIIRIWPNGCVWKKVFPNRLIEDQRLLNSGTDFNPTAPAKIKIDEFDLGHLGKAVVLDRKRPTDLVLFDRAKAHEMAKQYKEFHFNFEDVDFSKEIEKEKMKWAKIERKSLDWFAWKRAAESRFNWVQNYFFPLDVSYFCASNFHLTNNRKKNNPDFEIFSTQNFNQQRLLRFNQNVAKTVHVRSHERSGQPRPHQRIQSGQFGTQGRPRVPQRSPNQAKLGETGGKIGD